MATLNLKTMMAALLAGSLAATAGGMAYARTDGQAFDPAKLQQRVEKRVDRALSSTDATAEQKKKVADEASKRFTKALEDAGNALSAGQRQAFFKAWNERMGRRHG